VQNDFDTKRWQLKIPLQRLLQGECQLKFPLSGTTQNGIIVDYNNAANNYADNNLSFHLFHALPDKYIRYANKNK